MSFGGETVSFEPQATLKTFATIILAVACVACSESRPPNIVLILADDLGYGDVGAYGAALIATPHIDSLANDGVRLTQFYASGNVCTPSRAGLLTGRYPIRSGLANRTVHVGDERGLAKIEYTLAEQLQKLGYATALVGKWHLGDKPRYSPLEHGFDEFFGVLYSNDEPEQALLRGTDIVEDRIDPRSLALRFVDESVSFIARNASRPFFLFLSSTSPHKPLLPSAEFEGRSGAGAYGDVTEELDWGVGELLRTLEQYSIAENTLVIFTSDNGPFPEGSTGGLLGGKGTGWEGGYRVPFLARWPRGIEAGRVSSGISMNIDLFPTLLAIAGNSEAAGLELDGRDIRPLLNGSNQSPHNVLFFFNNERIAALRTERWRLMLSDYPPWRDAQPVRFQEAKGLESQLHDMNVTPTQQYDVSRDHPEEKRRLEKLLVTGRATLESISRLEDSTQYGDNYEK